MRGNEKKRASKGISRCQASSCFAHRIHGLGIREWYILPTFVYHKKSNIHVGKCHKSHGWYGIAKSFICKWKYIFQSGFSMECYGVHRNHQRSLQCWVHLWVFAGLVAHELDHPLDVVKISRSFGRVDNVFLSRFLANLVIDSIGKHKETERFCFILQCFSDRLCFLYLIIFVFPAVWIIGLTNVILQCLMRAFQEVPISKTTRASCVAIQRNVSIHWVSVGTVVPRNHIKSIATYLIVFRIMFSSMAFFH